MSTFLIYGASGYTGELCAEQAVKEGLRPILGGRAGAKLEPLARRLGLEHRVFDLQSPDGVVAGLRGVSAVLHAAGPFSATSRPMADACMRTGVNYLDITGEISVFEALADRDAEAKRAGITLLPGVGFDVVPSDCMAAHVKARLPTATRLRIAIGGLRGVSRGTAKTMVEGSTHGTRVRRQGAIVDLAEAPRTTIDFGAGARQAIGMSWGDVATAFRSTHIPNIEVFFELSPGLAQRLKMPAIMKLLLRTRLGQRLAKNRVEKSMPPGPSAEARAAARTIIVADAWDNSDRHVSSRLETIEPYTLTALAAVEIARRAAAREIPVGYQTPAMAFGADFILSCPDTTRVDL